VKFEGRSICDRLLVPSLLRYSSELGRQAKPPLITVIAVARGRIRR
jgi:hypothetical protein